MLKSRERFGEQFKTGPARHSAYAGWLIFLLLLLTQAGCRQAQIQPDLPELLWPKSTETPRIRLLKTVSKAEDYQIRKGMLGHMVDYITGFEDQALVSPYGVEVDADGRLYVVDTFLKTVIVFDAGANTYYYVARGEKPFSSPIDIAVDFQSRQVFVTDSKIGAVFAYHNFGREFIGFIGLGILERPTGIVVNAGASELLVVDTLAGDVLRFDLKSHSFKGKYGQGNLSELLHGPTLISVERDGAVLLTDALNFRVLKFDSNGNILGQFGSPGDGPGYFSRPRGVAADSDGNVYVVDALFDNVQIFSQEGKLLMAFGEHGSDLGEFWLPAGIHIDREDRIYIADAYNKRIQIFQYLKER